MAPTVSSQRHNICRKILQAVYTDRTLHPFHKLFLTGSFSQQPPPLMLPGSDSPPFPAVLEATAVPSITLPTVPQAKQLFFEALFPAQLGTCSSQRTVRTESASGTQGDSLVGCSLVH